jgi:3-dehydroquinate dehydratase II
MMQISVINGPNLNLLGTRQPEVYGKESLADLEGKVEEWAVGMGVDVDFFQSNDESSLVEAIQQGGSSDGIVINPGGFTHTSVAIADAVASVPAPVVEVHLSNIGAREEFRRVSLVEPASVRQISGRGATGYRDAIRHLMIRSKSPFTAFRYGPHRRNVADRRTVDGARATAVLVHGGYWFPGWDRDLMDAIAADLDGRGLNTLNVEYRNDPPWPGSGHDIATALATVDSTLPVVLLGHSAGAYLSLWAHRRRPVDLCIVLAPVTDFSLVEDVPPIETMRAAGAPSPMTGDERVVAFHGADDRDVSPEHSSQLGVGATRLAKVGHFDIINPTRPHWDAVVAVIDSTIG